MIRTRTMRMIAKAMKSRPVTTSSPRIVAPPLNSCDRGGRDQSDSASAEHVVTSSTRYRPPGSSSTSMIATDRSPRRTSQLRPDCEGIERSPGRSRSNRCAWSSTAPRAVAYPSKSADQCRRSVCRSSPGHTRQDHRSFERRSTTPRRLRAQRKRRYRGPLRVSRSPP